MSQETEQQEEQKNSAPEQEPPKAAPAKQKKEKREKGTNSTHEVIDPEGQTVHVCAARREAMDWMEEHAGDINKRQRFAIITVKTWTYRPKANRPPKLTPEERAERKKQREVERDQRRKEKEERRKQIEARKAERAAKKAEREKAREESQRAKAMMKDQVVETKSGAKIVVKQPSASTAQLQALARARAKMDEQKAEKKAAVKAAKKEAAK